MRMKRTGSYSAGLHLRILFASVATFAAAQQANCNVIDFGAKGDNSTEDTAALQKAIDSCLHVVFPAPGRYLSRPLNMSSRSNRWLEIQTGATIVAWGDVDTWNSTSAVRALIWADDNCVSNFTLNGGGVIDGQGWRWWPFMKTRPRPVLVQVYNAQTLSITNMTLIDAPSFHILIRGADMEVRYVNISANAPSCSGWQSAPNTDGINIGGHNIYVADSIVHNGDDCVPTNTGPNGQDSWNITVERVNCSCGTNGGVPIIATNASIRDVVYRDMTVFGTNQGAGMKISEAYDNVTGQWSNITWSDITIVKPRYAAIYTNVFQEDASACFLPPNPDRPKWLTAANITFRNIRAEVAPTVPPGCFVCSTSRPCTGYAFDNVVVVTNSSAPPQKYKCFNMDEPTSANGTSPVACS